MLMLIFFILGFSLIIPFWDRRNFASASSTGATLPGSAETEDEVYPWTNPNNAKDDNNVYTTRAGAKVGTVYSDNLYVYNFGFSSVIGASDVIDGITVRIDRKASVASKVTDNIVALADDNSWIYDGNNKADTVTTWGTSEASASYGSTSDTWGAGYSTATIRSTGFGVYVKAKILANTVAVVASIDCIYVTVTYHTSVVIPTVSTDAIQAGDVTITGFTGRGTISATGGANCDKRGIYYGTSSPPGSSSYDSGSYGTGSFTKTLWSLQQGTWYYYKMFAHNSAGNGYGAESNFLTPPSSMSGASFTATVDSQTQITLSWTDSGGRDGAYIEYAVGSPPGTWNVGSGTSLGVTIGTSKVHSSLMPKEHYYYKAWAVAVDGGQTSDNSNAKPYGGTSTTDKWTTTSGSAPGWNLIDTTGYFTFGNTSSWTGPEGWFSFGNITGWTQLTDGYFTFNNTVTWSSIQEGWFTFGNNPAWQGPEGWFSFGNISSWRNMTEEGWFSFGNSSYMIITDIFPGNNEVICPVCYMNNTFFTFSAYINHRNGTQMNITWTTWNGTILGQFNDIGNGTYSIIPDINITYDHLYNYTVNVTDGVSYIEKVISFSTDTYENCDTMNFVLDAGQFAMFLVIILFMFFMWMGYTSEKRSAGAFILIAGLLLLAFVAGIYAYLAPVAFILVPVAIFLCLIGINKWLIKPNQPQQEPSKKQ